MLLCELKWKSLGHVWLFVTPWIVVHGILQARILEWVAFPLPGDLPTPIVIIWDGAGLVWAYSTVPEVNFF